MNNLNAQIPPYVTRVTETLQSAGFEAYLVGGCVRDLILGRKPKDWDVTTNAVPEQIISLFEHTFYENSYGTVGVVVEAGVTHGTRESMKTVGFHRQSTDWPLRPVSRASDIQIVSRETSGNELKTVTYETQDERKVSDVVTNPVRRDKGVTHETLQSDSLPTIIVEVTPYRTESVYSDSRHPDEVIFSKKLEDDLKRRDFTVNALAYDPANKTLIDLYEGQNDIKDKIIRAIGKPEDRFNEDALRLLRAARFATELSFSLENETKKAVIELSNKLGSVSCERIRDEFVKIIMSDDAMNGIILTHDLNLLRFIIPELEKGIGVEQNGSHIYTVWEHNIRALQHAANHKWPLHIRLGALLHDISKPETRRWSNEKKNWTFYGHDIVGGKVSKKIMERLRFPVKLTNTVSSLVKYHLFFSDVEKITLSAVRRIVANVGAENVWDLMKLRTCDRIGMGRPVEKPYRLRKYEAMIEEAMRAPVSVGMLKIDGTRIMEVTYETPGPKLGLILHALLEEVLEDPELNNSEYLEKRTLELIKLPETELKQLGEEGKEKKAEVEEEELTKIRKKHGVK
jgi:poly(A) polymerase/tRNA nucleotidyltransferase (CCA-adding enzyme)